MIIKNKTFLVTGGAGFIGSHVTDALVARGGKVVIADNLSTGRRGNLNPKAKFYKLNVADDKKFDAVVKKHKPQYIYHFAYFVIVPKSTQNPRLDMDSLRGSINVLEAAKRYKVKKVLFSSSGFIYGNNPHLPLKETEPFEPTSPYAISKYAVEGYLRFYKKNFGVDYAILRNAAVYGPRQITGAMAAYIRDLKAGVPSEFYGLKTRDYVYIDDVVNANLRVLGVPAAHPNPVWNIGMGGEMHLIDLYYALAKLLKKKPQPVKKPERPGEQDRYCVDITKAKRDLKWKPRISLEEGLRRTLAFWKLI
ncbi:MAG: NAD-dependent epimerase/dehydratase family protein [Candidatus Liptonbacteria bacterium]|nr:NAD-dependent epimerase/dehydratase family protein [Candidatus Liptonbacteria bacterium]